MALQKEYTTPAQVSGDYWRITRSQIEIPIKRVVFIIELYKNQAARLAGAPSIFAADLVMSDDGLGDLPYPSTLGTDNIYEIGYTAFKTQTYMEGATDV